jgi:hypothetical protein
MNRHEWPPGPGDDGDRPRGEPANVEKVVTQTTSTPALTRTDSRFQCNGIGRQCVSSRQVSWWSVHQWVAERLADLDDWPMAGTPEWCELDDTDPRKVAALFDGAQHWSLRVETCQQQLAEASHDVSQGADWSSIADEMRRRHKVYIPRAVA